MKDEDKKLSCFLENLAAELREELSNLYLSGRRLASTETRKSSPTTDRNSAYADQSRIRMMRLARNLEEGAALLKEEDFMREACDIVGLVSQICEESADLAQYLGVELRFSCGEASHICAVHREYIRQLCYHLLSNALKRSASGGCVRVSLLFSGKSKRIALCVEDNGCGIAADRLSALFEVSADAGKRARPEGSGLGLPICTKIAEGHGGFITAKSKPGKGSEFTVDIPDEISKTVQFRQPNFFVSGGGIHSSLVGLADALPYQAFRIQNQL